MALEIAKNSKPPTKEEIKGRLIFGPIMILLGLAIIIFASYPKLQKARDTKKWAQTQGQITDAWIVAHKDGFAKPNQRNHESNAREEGNKFRIAIEYTYTVNDVSYSCKKRDLMQSDKEGVAKLRKARKIKENYLTNPNVTVFYNPENPKQALLKTGLNPTQWLLVVSPLILLIVGFPITYSGIKLTLFSPTL